MTDPPLNRKQINQFSMVNFSFFLENASHQQIYINYAGITST